MPNQQRVGTMCSRPISGECFAAYLDIPSLDEFRDLMTSDALVERSGIQAIREAFCGEAQPSRRISVFGPCIGKYLDRDIPAWYAMADGTRYDYVGILGQRVDLARLTPGQIVLAPGLIFQLTK